MELYNWYEERIYAKFGENISIVKKRKKIHDFIDKQLRKEYIRSLKLL